MTICSSGCLQYDPVVPCCRTQGIPASRPPVVVTDPEKIALLATVFDLDEAPRG